MFHGSKVDHGVCAIACELAVQYVPAKLMLMRKHVLQATVRVIDPACEPNMLVSDYVLVYTSNLQKR